MLSILSLTNDNFDLSNTTIMSVIIILLIASIAVASVFLGAFLISVKKGQFDDEESPPIRMLFDDKPAIPKEQIEAK